MRHAWWLSVSLLCLCCASVPRASRDPEASALAAVREYVAAEFTYASANQGFYDHPDCLEQPWACIPGWRRENGSILCRPVCDPLPSEYEFKFHGGFPPAWGPGAKYSPTSRYSFAVTAVPKVEKSRLRAFCGDSTQFICCTPGDQPPRVRVSECPAGCREIKR